LLAGRPHDILLPLNAFSLSKRKTQAMSAAIASDYPLEFVLQSKVFDDLLPIAELKSRFHF